MPAAEADLVYKDHATIVAELMASVQSRIPDANLSEDSVFRIVIEMWANVAEGMFLANQILHNDMFVQTASALALQRYGEMYGRPIKGGTVAVGSLRFTGVGGTVIPSSTAAAAPSVSGDSLRFLTTGDVTIPSPGLPTAPTAADGGAGNLVAGTYEYGVTFTTLLGETAIGAISNALVLAASHQTNLTVIPLGGTGALSRKIYRRKNGGAFTLVTTIANNTATTFTDSVLDANLGGPPPTSSTAEQIDSPAQAEDVGIEYNVGINTITTLSDVVSGVTGVTNPAVFTQGTDQEDIEVFRTELLDWMRAPKSGAGADLEAWAESVVGVETATAFLNDNMGTPTNGHATVRITGPGGTVPSTQTQVDVLAELQSHDVANVTLHVGTFTPKPINVTVVLALSPGYVIADVQSTVVQRISDYLTGIPVGGTVYVAGIYSAVFGTPGVNTLTISVPTSDTTCLPTEKATPGVITVS